MIATAISSTTGTAHERHGHAAPPSRLSEYMGPLEPVLDGNPAAESHPAAQQILAAEPEPAAEKAPMDGRANNGTFAKGNRFARGNPNARKMAALRSALLESVTPERMKVLGEKLYSAALNGDMAAMKLLFSYALGKPPDAVDPDRLDLEEWKILDASPTWPQAFRALLDSCPPGLAAEFHQLAQPGNLDEFLTRLDEARATAGARFGARVGAEREARIGK